MNMYVSGFALLCGMKMEIMNSVGCTALADFHVRLCMTTPLPQVCTGLGIFLLSLLYNLHFSKGIQMNVKNIPRLVPNYFFLSVVLRRKALLYAYCN